mmetsp:Transcript_87552/g.280889  ORF Transcript_87552/g.280889 Transcript_87552/m.280889 type:complete len:223 (+) Transcript_87552:660-1328(+)
MRLQTRSRGARRVRTVRAQTHRCLLNAHPTRLASGSESPREPRDLLHGSSTNAQSKASRRGHRRAVRGGGGGERGGRAGRAKPSRSESPRGPRTPASAPRPASRPRRSSARRRGRGAAARPRGCEGARTSECPPQGARPRCGRRRPRQTPGSHARHAPEMRAPRPPAHASPRGTLRPCPADCPPGRRGRGRRGRRADLQATTTWSVPRRSCSASRQKWHRRN